MHTYLSVACFLLKFASNKIARDTGRCSNLKLGSPKVLLAYRNEVPNKKHAPYAKIARSTCGPTIPRAKPLPDRFASTCVPAHNRQAEQDRLGGAGHRKVTPDRR